MDEQQDNDLVDHSFTGSSVLASVTYNHRTQEMTLYFKSGKSYDMTGVPPDQFENFCKAPSPGRFFNDLLKGKY